MKNKIKLLPDSRSLFLVVLLLSGLVLPSFGQEAPVEMADALRKDGKIYVVVASIGVIVGGLVLFLIGLEKRISRLEKEKSLQP